MIKKENAVKLVKEYNEGKKANEILKAEEWLNEVSIVIEKRATHGKTDSDFIFLPPRLDETIVTEILKDNGYNYHIENGFIKIIWNI